MRFALKKELMFFSRTARMFGVIFSIMIFSLADPAMMKGAQVLLSAVGDAAASQNIQISDSDAAAFSMLDNMSARSVIAGSIGDFTTTAALIVLLVLMQPSGGEQKKRSIIIPQCAGLAPPQYVTPKYIIYPLTVFASSVIALPLCGAICSLLFDGGISFADSLLAGVVVGIYIAFLVAAELALGICTARPGVAAIVTILSGNLLPTILALFRVDRFNPFALPGIAVGAANGSADTLDLLVSAGVSVVLGVILYFLTLFVLTAKKVENEGSEPLL